MARDTFPIKVAGIVVAVLLVVGIGIAGALLFFGGDDDGETEQVATSQEDLNELDEHLNDALARQRERDAAADAAEEPADDGTPDPEPSAVAAPGSADREPAPAQRTTAEPASGGTRTTSAAPSRTTAVASANSATGNATSHNAAGLRDFDRGNFEGALARFARARELAPRDPHVRNNYAWTLHKLGREREAAQELEAVLDLDPNREIAYANLGEVLLAQGDRAGAIAAYERFLELNRNPAREGVARRKLEQIRAGE